MSFFKTNTCKPSIFCLKKCADFEVYLLYIQKCAISISLVIISTIHGETFSQILTGPVETAGQLATVCDREPSQAPPRSNAVETSKHIKSFIEA